VHKERHSTPLHALFPIQPSYCTHQADLPNLAAGLAAAQEADIFVGIHGEECQACGKGLGMRRGRQGGSKQCHLADLASCPFPGPPPGAASACPRALQPSASLPPPAAGANTANAWMMRPGSSLLELTMHGFEETCKEHACPHSNVPKVNVKVRSARVRFAARACAFEEAHAWAGVDQPLLRASALHWDHSQAAGCGKGCTASQRGCIVPAVKGFYTDDRAATSPLRPFHALPPKSLPLYRRRRSASRTPRRSWRCGSCCCATPRAPGRPPTGRPRSARRARLTTTAGPSIATPS
jgi:hypothetical protein